MNKFKTAKLNLGEKKESVNDMIKVIGLDNSQEIDLVRHHFGRAKFTNSPREVEVIIASPAELGLSEHANLVDLYKEVKQRGWSFCTEEIILQYLAQHNHLKTESSLNVYMILEKELTDFLKSIQKTASSKNNSYKDLMKEFSDREYQIQKSCNDEGYEYEYDGPLITMYFHLEFTVIWCQSWAPNVTLRDDVNSLFLFVRD